MMKTGHTTLLVFVDLPRSLTIIPLSPGSQCAAFGYNLPMKSPHTCFAHFLHPDLLCSHSREWQNYFSDCFSRKTPGSLPGYSHALYKFCMRLTETGPLCPGRLYRCLHVSASQIMMKLFMSPVACKTMLRVQHGDAFQSENID